MKYANFTNGFILSFSSGEDFHQLLVDFTLAKRIPGSFYQGSGFLRDLEIGRADIKNQSYTPQCMSGDYEALSILGSVAEVNNSPVPNTQVVLIDKDLKTIGGNLLKGVVAYKLELFLFSIDIVINRKKGKPSVVTALDLPHHFQSR